MLVFGVVTTANLSAGEAKPQVNPGITQFQAFFTSFTTRYYFLYQGNMFTDIFLVTFSSE
jgi:hypothetical protein